MNGTPKRDFAALRHSSERRQRDTQTEAMPNTTAPRSRSEASSAGNSAPEHSRLRGNSVSNRLVCFALMASRPVCKQCGEEFNGDPEDKLCPDCHEQNAPDDDDGDDADLGLGIL